MCVRTYVNIIVFLLLMQNPTFNGFKHFIRTDTFLYVYTLMYFIKYVGSLCIYLTLLYSIVNFFLINEHNVPFSFFLNVV